MKIFFTEHKIFAGAILVLFIFSLLCQIMIGFLYQNMIKESHNMSSTKNKMLKICKLKFTNRYELHEKVVNIPVFVDKFIHSIKWGPFSAKSVQHFSGQLLLFSVFLTGAGACRAIITEATIGELLSCYMLAFVMLYGYFSVSAAVDLKGKKEILKTNLVDYLENNISVRIPQSKREQERLDKLEEEAELQSVGGEEISQRKKFPEEARKESLRGKEDPEEAGEESLRRKEDPEEAGEESRRRKEDPEEAGEEKPSGKKTAEIADFVAHKKREDEKKLAPEEVKELEGLLTELWNFY